jgi:bla regulator protein blaR1
MKPAILLLMTTLAGYGQPGLEPPKYEVASIKPNTDNDFRFAFRIQPDGSLAATGITLKRLMMTAYNAQGFRIVGGPDWVASSRWDLQAKPNRVALPEEVRQMLRTLLEDRFRLRTHAESRKMPVYELAVDSKGSKLPRVKDSETEPVVRVATGSIQLTKATPATFASQLSYALGQPVIDKTGLSGEFDFALEWTPETGEDGGPTTAGLPPGAKVQPASTPDGPSIFTAIPEQLGLRLKSARGPVEVTVIDAAQMPTAN